MQVTVFHSHKKYEEDVYETIGTGHGYNVLLFRPIRQDYMDEDEYIEQRIIDWLRLNEKGICTIRKHIMDGRIDQYIVSIHLLDMSDDDFYELMPGLNKRLGIDQWIESQNSAIDCFKYQKVLTPNEYKSLIHKMQNSLKHRKE